MDGANGLGKLLPKAITAKRKNRKQQKLARELDSPDAASSRRPSSNGDARASSVSIAADDDDDVDVVDAGSLTSAESSVKPADHWEPPPAPATPPPPPPVLSAHPSQIGYLTTSSPVVQANHFDAHPQYQPPSRSQTDRSSLSTSQHSRVPSASSSTVGLETSPRRSATRDPAAPAQPAPLQGRSRPQPRLDTAPPRTPPTGDKPAPLIVSTPPTPVEPVSASGVPSPERTIPSNGSPRRAGTDGSSTSQSMSAHWRSRSGSAVVVPSKLSNATLPPLTPTAENGEETPTATGFLSSVLSAAQSAASTLSNNIPGTGITIGSNKSRSSLAKSQGSAPPNQPDSEPEPAPNPRSDNAMEQKKDLAVRTLGTGDLSLSQLGIAEPAGPVASPASAKFADVADLRTRSDSAPVSSQTNVAEPLLEESTSRPRSLADTPTGDQSPSQADTDAKSPVQRTASIRSAIRPHRKRGSSAATGSSRTTVGAAIAAANSSAINPSAGFAAPKLTGFAIASKRRNRDFHNLFKSVPDDDYLIEDYSCALQREILAHGRLYVSEGHLCFSSNILGWTTTLVMSFDEIVSVEKRSTALLFKNGLMISTLHAKHIFASFTSRDATYDLIINIWKLGHPTLKSTLNGVRLEGTGGDKTEKVDAEPSAPDNDVQEGSDSEENSDNDEEDDDDFYDEEENEHIPDTQATEVSGADVEPEKPAVRKASGMTAPNGAPADAPKETPSPPSGSTDFPGPATHPPTDCGDSSSHYEKLIGEEIIPAPLGKVYTMVFGPSSAEWMSKWLTVDQKCTDLQMEDKRGLSLDNKTRNYTYIKPLNASIGPRQTKCIVAETLENFDLDKAINLSVTTQNPDVPSGNVFSVKTKYCLSWAENNATRFNSNCTVEWTGKSWLKGPIEKGVSDGQTQYFKDLVAAVKASVSSKSRIGVTPNGPPRGKKRLKKGKTLQSADGGDENGGRLNHATTKNWGPLESVRGLLEPLVDVVKPLLTGNVMYGLLVGLLVAMWFGFGSAPNKNPAAYGPDVGFYSPYRLAAYEEMWRREESELWDWLEARIGPERLGSESPAPRKGAPEPRSFEEKLRQGRIDEKEMEEAIRVTEEKLRVLKEVVAKTSRGQERASAKREDL
ncbi:hypothetical protein HIM_00506 [Hirsutella minnesotensis 3608]|nr:hypothetical protein HIM_00506 [Hirsutella minnesotensis 3608]